MEKIINFDANVQQVQFDDYNESEYAVARVGYLSTRPNSHELEISEEVLRANADTVLGKWMVAKMNIFKTDAEGHEPDEHIVGFFPKDQEIEFVEDDKGYLRAYATAVISKVYAKDYCKMFEDINNRSVSVEMKLDTENGKDMNDRVLSFTIIGVTTLGLSINPSCPESDVTFVRFSQEEADAYFNKMNEHNLTPLKKFAKERIGNMAKTYKIDKSEKAMSDKAWGDVDKAAMRDKIMEAENKAALVKAVYMLVEDGWEEAPSEHLKYPIMELKGDTFVYNRDALGTALGYAKKENETTVVNKIEKIYKKLGLDSDRKEEAKMSEEVNDTVMTDPAEVEKTEEEVKEEMAELEENTETTKTEDEHEEESAEDNEEEETEMSADDMKAEMARLQDEIEKRDNIIMEKDKLIEAKDVELCDLRAFKQTCMEAERASKVDSIMCDVAKFMDKAQADECRAEGLKCEFAEVDAWANKVKASVFDKVSKTSVKDGDFTRMSAPVEIKKTGSVWDRL